MPFRSLTCLSTNARKICGNPLHDLDMSLNCLCQLNSIQMVYPNETQWAIYRMVSRLADKYEEEYLNKLSYNKETLSPNPDWHCLVGKAKALRELAGQLLETSYAPDKELTHA